MTKSRPEILGSYLLENKSTIRQTAQVFSLSKSTVHIDVSKRLKKINYPLFLEVKKILDFNFKERNKRGGYATKIKYLKLKEKG